MSILPQLITNGIIAGAIYALIALGLGLLYGILRFVNLAHGEMAMAGAFLFYFFAIQKGLPWGVSAILAITGVVIIGLIVERCTFRPLRKANSTTNLVTSLGVSFLLQSIVMMIFGPNIRTYETGQRVSKSYSIWDGAIHITPNQIAIMVITVVILSALYVFLKYTRLGKAIRAVADNREVAAILGIHPNKIIMIVFGISSAIAAIAGILIANEQNLYPTMGFLLVIKAFTAVIIGGLGNITAGVIGGFLLGIIENLAIGITIAGVSIPTSFRDGVAFLILILILIWKPTGLLNKKTEGSRV